MLLICYRVTRGPDDLGLAGEEAILALGDKVRKTCSQQGDLEQRVASAQQCVASLPTLTDIVQNKPFSLEELVAVVGSDDPFILDLFLPTIFEQGQNEELLRSSAQEIPGPSQCPGQVLLKHAFFQLKELEDTLNNAQAKHSAAQKKYANYKTKKDKATSKKRKAAEMACDQFINKDPVGKELKLARRNQINRKRKGIKKVKKVREEGCLPEARFCLVAAFRWGLQVPCHHVGTLWGNFRSLYR